VSIAKQTTREHTTAADNYTIRYLMMLVAMKACTDAMANAKSNKHATHRSSGSIQLCASPDHDGSFCNCLSALTVLSNVALNDAKQLINTCTNLHRSAAISTEYALQSVCLLSSVGVGIHRIAFRGVLHCGKHCCAKLLYQQRSIGSSLVECHGVCDSVQVSPTLDDAADDGSCRMLGIARRVGR
jgi:hypothetical protein